jgi:hypothetical protein
MDETTTRIPEGESPKKKKSSKYWLSISVVLVMTALSLVFSLYNAGEGDIAKGGAYIYDALKGCNPWWLLASLLACDCLVFPRWHRHSGLLPSLYPALQMASGRLERDDRRFL